MNVEIGTEAAQFPEKEYINVIFLAVHYSAVILASFDGLVINISIWISKSHTVLLRKKLKTE